MTRLMFSAALVAFGWAGAGLAGQGWTTGGFEMPESALFDATRGTIVLSNIKGHPLEADGDGYLSLLDRNGTVIEQHWATGMDAPKGMAVANGKIYVADLAILRVVDAATGALLESVSAPGAQLLNDVTTDGNAVYISDMLTHTIWRYADGQMTAVVQDDRLHHPNGLLWDQGRLLIGSWGAGMQADFSTQAPGDLLSWSPESGALDVVAKAVGNIDGVVRQGDDLILSDWLAGTLWKLSGTGDLSQVATREAGLADIGKAGDTLLMPHMMSGQLEALALK